MPSAKFQPSFAAGVLSPALHGRVDLAKYDVGLKTGKNVFVHVHGGVSNRAGTEFVCEVMDHANYHTLIPFKRADNDNLMLLLGDETMKVLLDGGIVQDGGADYEVATPFGHIQSRYLDCTQSIDVVYFAHPSTYPQKLSRTSNTDWAFADVLIDPDITAPTIDSHSVSDSGTQVYKYKMTPIIDGVEGFASSEYTVSNSAILGSGARTITLNYTGSGADRYRVYRARSGSYAYIGETEDGLFKDDNLASDYTITPPEPSGLFGTGNDYPRAVTLFQQRLVFGGSESQPETVWASRTGNFENFTKSETTQADDRIELDLAGATLNVVRGLAPMKELVSFTSGAEFTLTGPDGILTATTPIIQQQGSSGTNFVMPLLIEDTVLFVDSTTRKVRDFRYSLESDGYSGNDLTLFVPHYFDGSKIISWTYAKAPHSLVWVALASGKLLSLTYQREHQIWAWCEHDVGGKVESVAAIQEDDVDRLYLVVKRTVNGVDVRYVERMHSREIEDGAAENCFFVDCGLTYDGAATSVIGGLDHLEGEAVVALADGAVVPNLTVSGGTIALPSSAGKVHVGLAYESEIENLPPAVDLKGSGSARGRPHTIPRVRVQIENTRGIAIGPASGSDPVPMRQTNADLATPATLVTGMVEETMRPGWNTDGTVRIIQSNPLPMTILGISPELSIGRTE